MRTLIVAHGFPPHSQGGAELCAYWHATTLARDFADAVLVIAREADLSRPEYAVRRERREGVEIAWINNTYAATRSFAETYDNPAITDATAALLDEFAPDVAHVHHLTGLSTGIVSLLAGRNVPCILTLHDYWLICHRGQLLDQHLRVCAGPEPDGCGACLGPAGAAPASIHRAAAAFRAVERRLPEAAAKTLRGAAERVVSLAANDRGGEAEARARFQHMRDVCARVSHFVAPSASIRDRFIAFGVPGAKISLIRYGIPPMSRRSVARTPGSPLRIGFLGSVIVSKGLHVLLEAYRTLPTGAATVEVFGAIAPYHGDNSYRTTLAPMLAQPGVRQHGVVPHAEIARVFDAIDLLVVPSIWPEVTGLVVLEALLAGVPVIASRIGGLVEAVRDEVDGLLFHAGDADDLGRLLRRMIDDPSLLARLSAAKVAPRTVEDNVVDLRAVAVGAIRARQVALADSARLAAGRTGGNTSIAAIVINYRAPDETAIAVRALAASRRQVDHIVVVDNDPEHPCADHLVGVMAAITYSASGKNLGFSGGVNVGISEARRRGATHVLLVNSDVVVPPDCVAALERALALTATAGIAGPLLLARSAPDQVASYGIRYASGTARMRHLGYGQRLGDVSGPSTREVDAASGAVMLISMAIIDRIGSFDESYFFSFEEIEFCLRARRAGISTIVTRDAVAFHAGGRSMGAESPRRLYFAARNHLKLATADRTGVRTVPRAALVVGYNLAHAVRAPGGSLVLRLGAVAAGVCDFWRGKGGDRPA